MTRWHFCRREDGHHSIDASAIRRRRMAGKSLQEIEDFELIADGQPVRLGDLFELAIDESDLDEILMEGDLKQVHGLGAEHDQGDFQVQGSVGNYLACGMTGGTLSIDGGAGDFVAAPCGPHKIGMSGGVVKIAGNVGNYAGHRMRRGTLFVQGSAGSMLAASMVAGTICIGGPTGENLAVGMKRGSLLLADGSGLIRQADEMGDGPVSRFSRPTRFDPGFLALYRDKLFHDLTRPLRRLPVFRTRADRNFGGQGEILFPANAETALG